jgi:hypothetical protein
MTIAVGKATGIKARLRRLGRSWLLGLRLDNWQAPKLAIGLGTLTFMLTYGAGVLARTYAPRTQPDSSWLAFNLFEHDRFHVSGEALLLIIPIVAYIPLASAQLKWWTGRRRAALIAIPMVVGASVCNLVELAQKGSITDFLLVGGVADFNAADIVLVVGYASLLAASAPDHLAVKKVHVVVALAAAIISLVALPFVGEPLNHLPFLVVLLASLIWITEYVVWRVRIGSRLIATLSRDMQAGASVENDLLLGDWELALSRSLHRDLSASWTALAKLASAYSTLGRQDDLRRIADEYLRMAEDVDNNRMKSWALHHRGSSLFLAGDLMDADRLWRQALQLAEQESDDRHSARLLGYIAGLEAQMDKSADSQRTYRSAIELADRLGDAALAYMLRHDASISKA